MSTETRNCQNCHNDFAIEPQDFQFYEKIGVTSPTFCPDCRFERRLLFWNVINLYRRPCDLCHSFNISVYPPEAPYTVYCPACWWSDKWDARDHARDYDFSRNFFEQLNDLWHTVPLLGLSIDLTSVKSSPYNHDAGHLKDCYLLFHAEKVEDSAYGFYVGHSQNMLDSSAIELCQMGYDSMHSFKTNRCVGTREQLSESMECYFCRDCQNCQNCFGSANLKNKKYVAWNKQLTEEEYEAEVGKYDLGSYRVYQEVQKRAEEEWRKHIPKSEYNEFVENCTGPNVYFSKNTKDSIESFYCEDSRYLFRLWGPSNKGCYDVSMWGVNLSESYECLVAGESSNKLRFCTESGFNLSDSEYCKLCLGGADLFGCVSVRKGRNMILNKQYEEGDFKRLRSEIREHMNSRPYIAPRGQVYAYGEFFPPFMSPFAYNTTLAQNFFLLTENGAKEKGYTWRVEEKREPGEVSMNESDLPDHIRDAKDEILKARIACSVCPRVYRIIESELAFLRQMNLPLPRNCPFCRINRKLDIWVKTNRRIPRECGGCGAKMESHYTEEEYKDVYCRQCYIKRREG